MTAAASLSRLSTCPQSLHRKVSSSRVRALPCSATRTVSCMRVTSSQPLNRPARHVLSNPLNRPDRRVHHFLAVAPAVQSARDLLPTPRSDQVSPQPFSPTFGQHAKSGVSFRLRIRCITCGGAYSADCRPRSPLRRRGIFRCSLASPATVPGYGRLNMKSVGDCCCCHTPPPTPRNPCTSEAALQRRTQRETRPSGPADPP